MVWNVVDRRVDELREHPLSSVIPRMRADEWRFFLEDVRERGILEPLHLAPDGKTVLDGRHRLEAAREVKIDIVPTVIVDLQGRSELEYMLRAAILRRHLSDDQRAVLAAQLYKELSRQARSRSATRAIEARWRKDCVAPDGDTAYEERPVLENLARAADNGLLGCDNSENDEYVGAPGAPTYEGRSVSGNLTQTNDSNLRSRVVAAQALGVKPKRVRRAVELAEAAPELAQKVLQGEMPLRQAEKLLQRQLKKAELDAAPASQLPPQVQVWHGDFRELGRNIADSSVDLILTDPPYAEEFLPLWDSLAELAARVLKPGGFLLAYTGHIWLVEVMAALGKHLSYYWLAGVHLARVEYRNYARGVWMRLKPVLIYAKPPVKQPPTWFADLVTSESPEKDLHEWGQAIGPARYFVSRFTEPGDLVLDPMAGSGSFALAALQEGRRAIAIELDAEHYEIIVKRLATLGNNNVVSNGKPQEAI
jgi:16S rRNA G966 N2-methylase RsmD